MNAKAVSLLARLRRVTATRRGLLIVLILSLGLILLSKMARSPVPSEVRTASNSVPGALGSPTVPDADLQAEWQRLKDPSRNNRASWLSLWGRVGSWMAPERQSFRMQRNWR